MTLYERSRPNAILVCLALFAFAWVVARACLQSVTIDEADSYTLFAAGSWHSALYPSSGNHVLNTILERFFTAKAGLNEFTLRLPAILGAALYIASAVYLCLLLTPRRLLQLPLLLCLVYNPLVFDYLVAARGYSLALGLMLGSTAILAGGILAEHSGFLYQRCALASLLLGLSFCANFSFAIADAMLLLMFFVFMVRRAASWPRLAAAIILPGIVTALLLCGSTLARWPRGELRFGETSLVAAWLAMIAASFYELPSALVRESWAPGLQKLHLLLAHLAVLLTLAMLASSCARRTKSRRLSLSLWLASVLAATLFLHWTAFATLNILLPKDRTALFLVSLGTLLLGTTLALRYEAAGRDLLRTAGTVVLAVAGIWFTGCLRLGYFKEWKYNADAKQIYWIVADLNHRCGVLQISTEWRYVGALNFYRSAYRNYALPEFVAASMPPPPGQSAYVMYYWDAVDLIKQRSLRVLYHNPSTSAVIAVADAWNCMPQKPLSKPDSRP